MQQCSGPPPCRSPALTRGGQAVNVLLDDAGGKRVGPRQKFDFQEVALWAAWGAADERCHGICPPWPPRDSPSNRKKSPRRAPDRRARRESPDLPSPLGCGSASKTGGSAAGGVGGRGICDGSGVLERRRRRQAPLALRATGSGLRWPLRPREPVCVAGRVATATGESGSRRRRAVGALGSPPPRGCDGASPAIGPAVGGVGGRGTRDGSGSWSGGAGG